ncbi:MAG: diguanylate cyclase [Pyrinomonadaceae bacterium]
MTADKQRKKFAWQTVQDRLANDGGVSVVTVDEHSAVLAQSNNNSMCQVLSNSEEFASSCELFCGRAFEMATEAGKPRGYKCYAGLNCIAVPITEGEKTLVSIVGRTFLKSQDYRVATQRAISGDWEKYPRTKFFENVILSGSPKHLETVADKLQALNAEEKQALFRLTDEETHPEEDFLSEPALAEEEPETPAGNPDEEIINETKEISNLIQEFHKTNREPEVISAPVEKKYAEETEEMDAWRALFGSLLDLSYKQACTSVLQFLQKRHSLLSIAWLERYENHLETILAGGFLKEHPLRFKFALDDKNLVNASVKGTPLELRLTSVTSKKNAPHRVQLYPIGIGGEIRSALVTADEIDDPETKRHISRFCRHVASDIEILRLREELMHRDRLERAVQVFNESVKHIDSEDFWSSLAQILSELLKSERSSLLIFDEKSDSFLVKAATGARAEFIKRQPEMIGERVAKNVLKKGKPFIRRDLRDNGALNAAPPDWKYKSNSFISYPIKIAGREIGVLNVTDKTDGAIFDQVDLELLDVIVPHLAVLIDRALLKQKAGEYEHLSVTDALTGLLNRRYLEERLTEEIQRSNRHGYPMSFMMIDVDDFKTYNDAFTHLEGDRALRIVGRCLKEILRGADVAARYGGEEFSILLPQTNSFEAESIAERIRQKVAMTRFPNRQVTISIGIVSASASVNTAKDLIWAADTALYQAKRLGKNNVQIYEHLNLEEISEAEKSNG